MAADQERMLAREVDFSSYALPSIDTIERDEVYERILEAESCLASSGHTLKGYDSGTASYDDEIFAVRGLNAALITTEHATTHYRQQKNSAQGRRRKGPDLGTAGLGYVVHKDTDASFVSPLGRQTGDANHDIEHPLKEVIRPMVAATGVFGHLSLHGMNFGRVASLDDERAFNVVIGIGDNPTEETKDFADKALQAAATYDLRAAVNQSVIRFKPGTRTPRLREDNSIETISFAARGSGTTRAFTQAVAESQSKPFITAQIELSSSMRLLHPELSNYPGEDTQRIGVHLGYLFVHKCVELIDASQKAT